MSFKIVIMINTKNNKLRNIIMQWVTIIYHLKLKIKKKQIPLFTLFTK